MDQRVLAFAGSRQLPRRFDAKSFCDIAHRRAQTVAVRPAAL